MRGYLIGFSLIALSLPATAQVQSHNDFRLESVSPSVQPTAGVAMNVAVPTARNLPDRYYMYTVLYPTLGQQRSCASGLEWTMTTVLSDCQPMKRRLRNLLRFSYAF